MKRIGLIIIGGFLGAGKTTSILAMAKKYLNEGLKVGVVTNDQGSNLVDTQFLKSEGLDVLEVTGGCFCCNFDEFVERINELSDQTDDDLVPDVILAEPVGSCTDLIATIFKPMLIKHAGRFVLHPFSVVVDPKRVKKVMMEKEGSPFPSEINYLFKKQIEEADIIVLNKIDILEKKEIDSIKQYLSEEYKGAQVITASAQKGIGIDEWSKQIHGLPAGLKSIKDIDYEIYAKAEAQLGWLNCIVNMELGQVNTNEIFEDLLGIIGDKLKTIDSEIAHLKLYGIADGQWFKLSLTSVFDRPLYNKPMTKNVDRLQVIINARVSINPEVLTKIVADAFNEVCSKWDCRYRIEQLDSFMPAEPKPKYRM